MGVCRNVCCVAAIVKDNVFLTLEYVWGVMDVCVFYLYCDALEL